MAISSVREASAVFHLGHYLVGDPGSSHEKARESLEILLAAAGKRLMVSGEPILAKWPVGDEPPVAQP